MTQKYLTVSSQKIAYYEAGQGTALIILHGWGISSDYFCELQKLLSRHFHVFNIDLPGFGNSSLPGQPFSVADYADLIEKFITAQKISSYYILGHSFGGRIALKLGSRGPKELKGLILTGCAGLKPSLSLRRLAALIIGTFAQFLKKVSFAPKLFQKIRTLILRFFASADYAKLNNKIMQETFKKVVQEDLRPLLPQIKAPTLLLWGRLDRLTPLRDGIIMSKEIPNSRLVILEQIGHRLPYTKPQEFTQTIVNWMKV